MYLVKNGSSMTTKTQFSMYIYMHKTICSAVNVVFCTISIVFSTIIVVFSTIIVVRVLQLLKVCMWRPGSVHVVFGDY